MMPALRKNTAISSALLVMNTLKKLFTGDGAYGTRFQKLNKIMQDLFIEWLPYDKKLFSNKYIDPFDVR